MAFRPSTTTTSLAGSVSIVDGVSFDTVAREWRCKWSPDDDKASLSELQQALDKVVPTLKGVDGVTNVERVVCGGCLDFKVITSLSEEKFGAWEEADFEPEASFLEEVKAINGVTFVETQSTFFVLSLSLSCAYTVSFS